MAAGSFAALAVSSGVPAFARAELPTDLSEVYVRVAFNLLNQSNGINLLAVGSAGEDPIYVLFIDALGYLGGHDILISATVLSPAAIGTNGWHTGELFVRIAGPSSMTAVWLEGSLVAETPLRDMTR